MYHCAEPYTDKTVERTRQHLHKCMALQIHTCSHHKPYKHHCHREPHIQVAYSLMRCRKTEHHGCQSSRSGRVCRYLPFKIHDYVHECGYRATRKK